jgi:hypothetical protein
MIYYEPKSRDFTKIYLNLEELICLSEITKQDCVIKANDFIKKTFDLSGFGLTEEIPRAINHDISDFVCMYENDFDDIEGAEFLSYRKNQEVQISRLEKFKKDIIVSFSKPNYYESKYFSSDNIYRIAIKQASKFSLNRELTYDYSFVRSVVPRLPLICLNSKHLPQSIVLPQNHYFYYCDSNLDEYFASQNIVAKNIQQFLYEYHPSLKDIDIEILMIILVDNFTTIYGTPYDYLFGILCKYFYLNNSSWEPNLLDCNFASLNNYRIKTVKPKATFSFAQKDLNLSRSEILSALRLRECVDYGL